MIIRIALLGIAALLILFIFSQVIYPALRNRPLFPMLNFRRMRLNRKLEALRAAETDTRLRLEAERLQIRVTELDLLSDAEINEAYDQLIRKQESKK